jgi:hypothetical protein
MKQLPLLAAALLVLLASSSALQAIPRDEVLARAHTYASHPWHCSALNQTGTCAAGYVSVYPVGDFVGLPYDWGGYSSIDQFDQGLSNGLAAGSYPSDGITDCTIGVDCSGFVSRCWKAAHTTTSGMSSIATEIDQAQVEPGDAYNDAGYHVVIYEATQANGDPLLVEAAGYNVHVTFWEPWTYLDYFVPIRYQGIEDAPAEYQDGTAANPVVVTSFPFVDTRDTSLSMADLFDYCLGAAPGKKETGPEVIYRVDLTQPGTLTAALQDGAGVDIDVHLYAALNELDCVARDDASVSLDVGCGSVWVVADTYNSSTYGEQPGQYTLTIDFEASGASCGDPHPVYTPGGAVGEPCGYEAEPDLPFCNPNLGGVVCVYSVDGSGSFCSYPCAGAADCQADFPQGCCEELDVDYFACLPHDWCTPITPEPDPEPQPEKVEVLEPVAEVVEVIQETQTEAVPETVPDTDTVTVPDADTVPEPVAETVPDTVAVPDAKADAATGPDTSAPEQAGGDWWIPLDEPVAEGGGGGAGGCSTGGRAASPLALFLLALSALYLRRRALW